MKVFHLNCGSLCPFGLRELYNSFLNKKEGPSENKGHSFVCHCLLIEMSDYLILVDTGLGLKNIEWAAQSYPGAFFTFFDQKRLSISETAFYQIKKLGYSPKDVKHILATHLDFDHVGGLPDFPKAQVHLYRPEFDYASLAPGRYYKKFWDHNPFWVFYDRPTEYWRGLPCIRPLKGIAPEIFFILLPGHTRGHCGVVVETGEKTLVFAGDAYFYNHQLTSDSSFNIPLFLYNNFFQWNKSEFKKSLATLKDLNKELGPHDVLFCSHDKIEFGKF